MVCNDDCSGVLVPEVVKTQRHIADVFFDQGHGGLQVITFGTRHAQFAVLYGCLDFELAVFDQALNFFTQFGLDAFTHFDDLLDLVPAHFLNIAFVQKAHIHIALGQFAAQNIFDLAELKIRIADKCHLFVFEINGGARSLEVKTGTDFFGCVFYSVFYVDHIGFTNGVKRGHVLQSSVGCMVCRSHVHAWVAQNGLNRSSDNDAMLVQNNVPLQAYNSFHIVAKAHALVRIACEQDVLEVLAEPQLAAMAKFVLGGGSNIVLTGDVKPLVLKVEVMGRRLLREDARSYVVEAGAGENWHSFVSWTLAQGWPGLENMALIPGTVGAAPVQNIGAYGVELQDRFESLDAIDLQTGRVFTLHAAQCAFAYRDSVFKHESAADVELGQQAIGLRGRALILRVRFALPKAWKPELGYADLQRCLLADNAPNPSAQQIFDWVCAVRRSKLPDPAHIGNVGSFFKNPTVSPEQCVDIIARDPTVVHYPLPDGSIKLAAGWLIDACGWRGKSVGQAGVYTHQALVLVNRGSVDGTDGATGGEVMTLARAIQTSVYERFGIMLEPEPVVV